MKLTIYLFFLLLISNYSFSQDFKLEIENLKLKNELNERKINDLQNELLELKEIINHLKSDSNDLDNHKNTLNSSSSMNSSLNSNLKSSASKTYGQCKATTQKGTRCSRSATATGYCWQHG